MSLKLTRMRTQLGLSAFPLSLKESPLQGSVIITLRTICFHIEHWSKHLAGERPISLFSPVLHSAWGVDGEEKNKVASKLYLFYI